MCEDAVNNKYNNTVESIMASMTTREKIGQTSQEPMSIVATKGDGRLEEFLQIYPVGSLFVGGEVIKDSTDSSNYLRKKISCCQDAALYPLSIAGDLENGAGGAVRGLTAFPHLMALGATDDLSLALEYGKWTALEATNIGFNWVFGPVVDLAVNWLNPVVNVRCLGHDPKAVSKLATALIRGYQENGLSAAIKHFPGDGVDFRDQHLCLSVNSFPEEHWLSSFGQIYKSCIDAGVHSVMAGHIALPWMDPKTKNNRCPIPATVSKKLLCTLLRDRLNFDGVIVSDALIMAGFTSWASHEERIIEAFNAGIDVMLWPGLNYFALMEKALENGRVTHKRLDQSVRRVLTMKIKQGLIKQNKMPKQDSIDITSAPRDFAKKLAERSITLVRNDSGLLPLNRKKIKNMLVLYASAYPEQGEKRIAPLLKAINDYDVDVTLIINGNCLDIQKREEAGESYDSFLTIFDLQMHKIKNTMRPMGEMSECIWTIQNVETMSPIVISLGTPFLLNDMPFIDTLINTYSPNIESQKATATALFGDIEFSGVSPVNVGGNWG